MSRDAALTRVLEESATDLLAYLSRRVGPDDAADLLGETMVIAWRRSSDLPDEPERSRMWLFGIARGTLANHGRGQRRRWALADRLRLLRQEDHSSPAADEGLEVRDAIARLDPDLAEIVRLVHWDRLSLVHAAQLLGIPSSTARGRYARARELLRAELAVGAAPNAENGAGFA
ncbi:RNA polymerase subunit sigma-24 [Microbacterium sp. Leaf161]|uniref:RNA polymerase sigma factor n=1 Tax=Microbacterium sp. Leaf161 TaxID=1736281 RepID=UPI0006FAE36E|nr:sigma-70 family RNA polymerase sigma factor [Microbacterium sp. Leaf161]KQR45373.1 RNA polymerase subunit sigma-24 [Microbacterium sp. Leaf161]